MRLAIIASILAMVAFGSLAAVASADGNGSPDDCEGGPTVTGDPEATYTAPDGLIVDGVCIKSGSNMFDGNKHSGVLDDGTYEDGCYEVEGVGSPTVTVTRLLDGSSCQAISHIDIITSICSDCSDPCDVEVPPPECENDPCLGENPPAECSNPCLGENPPEECIPVTEVCVDGEVIEAPESEATGDCDPVRLCVDGDSITVTEFDAENDPDLEDADAGSCVPGDEPPPSTPPPVEEVEEVVEEQPVEEVAGVVEEVAALPSAGYGDTASGSSFAWALALAAGLISLGGVSAAAVARRIR